MVNFQMAYFTYASAVWQMVSLKRPVNGLKTEFFVDQTAKNAKNAETADKRDAGLLLGRESLLTPVNALLSIRDGQNRCGRL